MAPPIPPLPLLILVVVVCTTFTSAFQLPSLSRRQQRSTVTKYIDGDNMLSGVDHIPSSFSHPLIDEDFVEILQAKEDACLPNCSHGWFTSVFRGAKLHYRRFLPPAGVPVKGVVVWMHGITSFSGVAFDLEGRKINMALMSETLVSQGYACYAFDMYGHGYSEGVRHYVKKWENNLQDYQNFVNLVTKQHQEDTPLFLCGESYGGCLTLHLAKHYQDFPEQAPKGFDSILLLAPAVMAETPPAPVYYTLRYGLAPLFPRWIPFFMPHPINPDRIWRDAKVRALHDQEIEAETSLGGGGKPFRLGTAVSLLKALKQVREETIPHLTTPLAVVHGAQDFAVPIEGTEYLLDQIQTPEEERAVLTLEGAYHDLLADPDAEDTMNFITGWIEQRLNKRKSGGDMEKDEVVAEEAVVVTELEEEEEEVDEELVLA